MRSDRVSSRSMLVVGWVIGVTSLASAAVAEEGLPPPPPRPEGAKDIAIRGEGASPPPGEDDAATPPPPPVYDPDPEPTRSADEFRHDGGFLRFTMGPLIAAGSAENLFRPGHADRPSVDGSIFGVGSLAAISGGGSLLPGLVLAARLGIGVLVDPQLSEENQSETSYVMKTIVIPTIGPVIDVYPWPEEGLHFFANPSLTVAHLESGDSFDLGLVGYSLAGGVGYEAWLSEQWSVGGQLRIDGSGFERDDDAYGETTSVTWWTPSIQVAFTYH